ncbi:peroxiredoxin [Pullulanibacillus pueri]|uniref:Thiol-disulfide oxidoreductase ResA n=1 Tax=Pullulanibacillus pueri TaxID=1437324 RepID=A0A8J3ENP7_9BACL|nr:thiol-disulfide oxidoreductase ResA [Pullulanibacillus pueri]MBM7683709.1 peroxiredoxin [Pullulanibacillus pueri]GGH85204.1 thiol-disulfide oxidoreductase ResA [Pullulanibacillus pueri]
MKNRKLRLFVRTVILFVIVIAMGYTIFQVVKSKNTVKVGDTAENFTLKNLDGRSVSLNDLRGKGVMLNFWGSWCKPCEEEMPYIEAAYKQKPDNVEIYGINVGDSNLVAQKFMERVGATFPTLLDHNKDITHAYTLSETPTTFFIDKNGTIKKISLTMTSSQEVLNNLKLIAP